MKYPSSLRRFIVPFLPEVRRLQHHKHVCGQLLEPILRECLEKHGKEKVLSEDFQDEQGVLLSWILNHVEDKSSVTHAQMATYQMICEYIKSCLQLKAYSIARSVIRRNPYHDHDSLPCHLRFSCQTPVHPAPARRDQSSHGRRRTRRRW